ncbi:MAG TPA: tetratricopeptide repeat protein [Holophaga sp.]|nr:tetratricopeptide repeat protein [Holophaga sp.]
MNYQAILLPALVASAPSQVQTLLGNEKCVSIVQEGINLIGQNKFNEALQKFLEAEKLDPKASGPLSGRALTFLSASHVTQKENVQNYRKEAENLAKAALARQPKDVVAQEVLRILEDGPDSERYTPDPLAKKSFEEGDRLFGKKQFVDALKNYEDAIRIDPKYADAIVYAGDCYFSLEKFPEAETYFRKATVLDPLHENAWRYLADSLLKQGKVEQAKEALLGAISARPSSKAAWDRLSEAWGRPGGRERKIFKITPMVRAVVDGKTKQTNIVVDQGLLSREKKDDPSPDFAAWLAYGLAQATKTIPPKPGEAKKTPFEAEVEIWTTTLKVANEIEISTKKKLRDDVLIQMRTFNMSGDLKPAVFLLMFKESYRSDFEAWKNTNPTGVKSFIEKYSLRP